MTNRTKLWYINTSNIFEDLSEEDKRSVEPMLLPVNIKKRGLVYSAGERSDTVYILKEGRIKINHFSEDGRELTLDILEPGDIFGELSLTEEERHSSAEALEDSFLCAIKRADFERFISMRPFLSLKVTKLMGSKLRTIENRLEKMIFNNVRERVLSTIYDLADKYGIATETGVRVSIRLSHQEIANLVGASRETVTMELNKLKKEGELVVKGRDIIVPAGKRPSSNREASY